MISVTASAATDVGRHRRTNEDAILVASPVFAVADGMGGYAGGAEASAIAVEHLSRLRGPGTTTSADVLEALAAANHEIVRRGRDDPATPDMGTTVVGLALVENDGNDYWFVFNIGDSRIYHLNRDAFVRVSVDHSYTQELVAEGRITEQEALNHPERNVITRSLGSEPDVEPDLWLCPVESGERYLLCSDGLTREIDEASIEALLRAANDPDAACTALVAAALQAGAHDNVSVVVVDVDEAESVDEATVPSRSRIVKAGRDGGEESPEVIGAALADPLGPSSTAQSPAPASSPTISRRVPAGSTALLRAGRRADEGVSRNLEDSDV